MKAQLIIPAVLIILDCIDAQENSYISSSPIINNEFAWNLFRNSKSSNRNAENFILCPTSIQLLLSVLEVASDGATREQIKAVTNNVSPNQLYYILNPNEMSSEIKSANGIFVDDNEQVNLNVSLYIYKMGGDVYALPLQKQSELAKSKINEWASNATNGHIPRLLSPENDISSVRAILASAIYFRSTWKYQFMSSTPRNFYKYFNDAKQTDYMEVNGYFKTKSIELRRNVRGSMINLPYKDNTYSMLLLVPGSGITLKEFINNMDHNTFTELIRSLDDLLNNKVHLLMPKFKISSRASLVSPLQKMGLVDIFSSSKSKLSKLLFSEKALQVSEILQQSTLEVDENGTIATSATASFIVPLSAAIPETIEYVIDKPFIAVIIETASKTPIFIARIVVPNEI